MIKTHTRHSLTYRGGRVVAAMATYWAMLFSPVAWADFPLLTTGPGTLRDATEMRGYSFHVGHDMTVTGLAKFDGNGNGILDDLVAPQVGLWNTTTSELIVSALIDEQAVHQDNMFVAPIEPIELPAGNYTLATQVFNDEEPYIRRSMYHSPVAVVRDVKPVRQSGSDFILPTRRSSILGFGPNLLIEQPLLAASQPSPRSVFQRQNNDRGTVPVAGSFDDSRLQTIEARGVPMDGFAGSATPWQPIATQGNQFADQIELPSGGWYQIEIRGLNENSTVKQAQVPQVGVGEVFVIAGQSNSANHGLPALTPSEDRVSTLDANGLWRHAADPQPIATGTGGSPWPVLGDLLVQQLDVPVGFVSVGWGGTRVDQWLPGASGPGSEPLYDRLRGALETLGPNGARAVLWHQGESDALENTSQADYADRLTEVIQQSRRDAGYDIPWGVAQAAFLPQNSEASNAQVLAAQLQVIQDDPLVFAGPLTDDLLGAEWRYDQVHFNQAGLQLHAQRWLDAVVPQIVPEPSGSLIGWMLMTLLAVRRRPIGETAA